jgi:hypothetical protein
VSGFSGLWNDGASAVDLSWVNPPDDDLMGVLIVRAIGVAVSDAPAVGVFYQAGDVLPDGGVVVFAGEGTSTSDPGVPPGRIEYRAWAYDDSGNYSAHRSAWVLVPTEPYRATLQIGVGDPANMTVTVTSQPAHYTLSGSAGIRPAALVTDAHRRGQLSWTAVEPGAVGNNVTLELVVDQTAAAISVSVNNTAVRVTFHDLLHSSQEIADAVNNDPAASLLLRGEALAPGAYGVAETPNPVNLAGGSGGDILVWLDLRNDGVFRRVFNAKALLTNSTEGALVGAGEVDANPIAFFGHQGLDVGAMGRGWFRIEGFSGSVDPIEVELEIRDAPFLAVSGGWDDGFVVLDTEGSGIELSRSSELFNHLTTYAAGVAWPPATGDSRFRHGFITADATMMYLGNQNMPTVIGIDTATFDPTVVLDLDDGSGVGHVDSVVSSPDGGALYAVVNYGCHAAAWKVPGDQGSSVCGDPTAACKSSAEDVDLVKIDLGTLAEIGRVNLVTDSALGARGRRLSMSADGSVGALPVLREGKVFILDLDGMAVTRVVDVSAIHPFVQSAAVAPDGTQTYVAFREGWGDGLPVVEHDGTLTVVDHSDWSTAQLAPPTLQNGTKLGFLRFGPDGKLYHGRKNLQSSTGALSVYDPATGSWDIRDLAAASTLDFEHASAIAFSADGSQAWVADTNTSLAVHLMDLATGDHLSEIATRRVGFGHKAILSPF